MNFEQYLQNKGLSEGVIKRYRAEMRRHRQFLHLLGKSPECATKKDLLDYLQSEKRPISRYQVIRKRPLSNRTKQRYPKRTEPLLRLPNAAGFGGSKSDPVYPDTGNQKAGAAMPVY